MIDLKGLTYANRAMTPAESVAPELWPEFGIAPCLGPSGSMPIDMVGNSPLTKYSTGVTWEPAGMVVPSAGAAYRSFVQPVDESWSVTFSLKDLAIERRVFSLGYEHYVAYFNASIGLTVLFQEGAAWIKLNIYPALGQTYTITGKRVGATRVAVWCDGVKVKATGTFSLTYKTYSQWGFKYLSANCGISQAMHWNTELSDADLQVLSSDPLLPFRKKPYIKYFLPFQIPADTTSTFGIITSKTKSKHKLTYANIARNANESIAPELYPYWATLPSLGPYGNNLIDSVSNNNLQAYNTKNWSSKGMLFSGDSTSQAYVMPDIDYTSNFSIVSVASPSQDSSDNMLAAAWGATSASENWIIWYDVAGAAKGWSAAFGDGIGRYRIWGNDTLSGGLNISSTICASFAFTDILLYVDGNLIPVSRYDSSFTTRGTSTSYIGRDLKSTPRLFNGCLSYFALYRRLLSSNESLLLSSDPYLPFRKQKSIVYSIPTSSSSGILKFNIFDSNIIQSLFYKY